MSNPQPDRPETTECGILSDAEAQAVIERDDLVCRRAGGTNGVTVSYYSRTTDDVEVLQHILLHSGGVTIKAEWRLV